MSNAYTFPWHVAGFPDSKEHGYEAFVSLGPRDHSRGVDGAHVGVTYYMRPAEARDLARALRSAIEGGAGPRDRQRMTVNWDASRPWWPEGVSSPLGITVLPRWEPHAAVELQIHMADAAPLATALEKAADAAEGKSP